MPDPEQLPGTLEAWLAYLEQLHPKHIALGLDRVGQVRERMALRPAFPVITVAGTNGKGSVCAMLERIYLEAGYRVACYTSPHLLRYNERVRIDAIQATDAALCEAFRAVELARQGTPLTYFEFGTLAAMQYFIRAGVDVAILEVGLGGRLDAVNIFDADCAIITSIDLDHIEYLGSSRESIGREKAGVYRAGVPAICGDMQPPATVPEHARRIGADYRQIGVAFRAEETTDGWCFRSREQELPDLPRPALYGRYQLGNAACALEAVHALQHRLPVPLQAVRDGLQRVTLAGRYQVLPGRPCVILDVAHNPHAARALADNLRQTRCAGRTLAVFAMLADKDIPGVVAELAGLVDAWFVADIHHVRGATAAVLASALAAWPGASVACCTDVAAAFKQACLQAGENDRIVVFGSFYTVADVLQELPAGVGRNPG